MLERVPADFSTPLLCTKCGQEGTATWEPERPDPVGTSNQFYLRVKVHAKVPRVGVDIVCTKCGAVHRGQVLGPSPGMSGKPNVPGRV